MRRHSSKGSSTRPRRRRCSRCSKRSPAVRPSTGNPPGRCSRLSSARRSMTRHIALGGTLWLIYGPAAQIGELPARRAKGKLQEHRSRRVNVLKIRQFLLATVIAIVAVACGSGGSGMSQSSGTTPLIATGTITGFGSIYVNGIHFQTTSATIRKNAQTVDQSQLAVGEVARIKGSKDDADNTGVAEEVDVDEAVIGPIDKIDTTDGTVTVLAQIVKINAGTSFSKESQPADITAPQQGAVSHVTGP